MTSTISKRSVRTFVLRQGRLTAGQKRSHDLYWSSYGLEITDDPLDLEKIFGRVAPLWLEIGFGDGEALVEIAAAHPHINFIGIEVHMPGVGHALGEIASRDLANVRVVRHDALEILEHRLMATTIERLLLYFPDPWHKTRHHKRRMVSPLFLDLMSRALVDGGHFHFATDWASYATWVEEMMKSREDFQPVLHQPMLAELTRVRPTTRFEKRGLRLGHEVRDMVFSKRNPPA